MTLQLIIIQVITFIALIIVLRILFYGQLNSALKKLKRLHEENLGKEEELKKQLEEIKMEREKELLKTREYASVIIKDAKGKAEKAGQDFETKSRQEAQKMIEHARTEVERLRKEVMAECHDKAVELSIEMLKMAFTGQGKAALQHELMTELINEIKIIEKSKFTVHKKDVKILTALPLQQDEKKKLMEILKDKMGGSVDIEESVDTNIIAGLIIKIGALTIDGSLKNKLKKITPYLKEKK